MSLYFNGRQQKEAAGVCVCVSLCAALAGCRYFIHLGHLLLMHANSFQGGILRSLCVFTQSHIHLFKHLGHLLLMHAN